jgi:hypothetical protein
MVILFNASRFTVQVVHTWEIGTDVDLQKAFDIVNPEILLHKM